MYLQQLILDESISITEIEDVLSGNDVQLKFKSIEVFDRVFNKFLALLYDYASKIKSIHMPSSRSTFEDTVKIISILEDKLEININHIVIEAHLHEDIKQLIDFYYDDIQDGNLNLAIQIVPSHMSEVFKTPIEVIAYIERNKYLGVSISLDVYDEYEQYVWEINKRLHESIEPYVSAVFRPDFDYTWSDSIFLILE